MDEPKLYRIVRPLLRWFMKLVYRPVIIGTENIPDGRVVLAGNHTNYLDCLLLISSTKRTIHFLAKDSLFKGWKKIIFKNMGIIPVNRKEKNKDVMDKAREILNSDKVIGIFPEGTINRTDEIIMPFKMGAVKMAWDTNSFIVPFVIKGEYKVFRKSVKLEFLKPYRVVDDLDLSNKELMNIIKDKLKGEK